MRQPHFRPKLTRPLTRETPFPDDQAVIDRIALLIPNSLAAMAPDELTKLRRSFNTRHAMLYGKQEARARNAEAREIALLNRYAEAHRRAARRVQKRRERALAEAIRKRDHDAIFYARMALQEVEEVLTDRARRFLSDPYSDTDWLAGMLDEIEAALRVTNPGSKLLASRSRSSVVVAIAEAVIEPISGLMVSADAIAKQEERRRNAGRRQKQKEAATREAAEQASGLMHVRLVVPKAG